MPETLQRPVHRRRRRSLIIRRPPFLGTNVQCKLKRRAGTVIGYGPQPAAVILNNRTANRQSHNHSLRLGSVESIQDLSEILPVASKTGGFLGNHDVIWLLI